jgi:hypothetical protein
MNEVNPAVINTTDEVERTVEIVNEGISAVRIIVGGVDIANMATALQVNMAVGELSTVIITLAPQVIKISDPRALVSAERPDVQLISSFSSERQVTLEDDE